MAKRKKFINDQLNTNWIIPVLVITLSIAQAFDVQGQGTRGNSRSRRGASLIEIISQQMMTDADKNADKAISKNEMQQIGETWFDRINPDRADLISREEFLMRFDLILPASQGGRRRSVSRGPNSNRNLGVFLAVDENKDAFLSKGEWTSTFNKWFLEWRDAGVEELSVEQIMKGLESEMPRTNMTGAYGQNVQERIPGLPSPPPAPILSPNDAIQTIDIDPNFHLELMASEPTVEDPISITFDSDGRMFVIEMRNYMLDMDRSGERDAIARISLLEDSNGDGRYDHSTVFLDQLINPRSVSAYRGGIFYVADGKLYFAQDTNADRRADMNLLVDPDYGGGNIEHAPNGMLPAMDNWIYNARSQRRYRWIDDKLIIQPTENRGQWGITQDNYGRLFFNVNNSQLLGDFTPPNYLGRNPNFQANAGLNLFVSTDQRVFSNRMNTGINRGYSREVLDDTGRAYVFASSCGPVIYRGDNFPQEFVGNAFVCDPALNLIKRNLVFDQNLTLSSRFAYPDREFIASTDERFRPVNAFNGPDGTLWLVDMYRGIAQYGMFMTEYLKKETLERELHKGIHLGRIYRVVSNEKPPSPVLRLSLEDTSSLVNRLGHPNGWVRDTAQRLLVERQDKSATTALVRVISSSSNPLQQIHALWAIEGIYSAISSNHQSESNSASIHLISLKSAESLSVDPELSKTVFDSCLDAINHSDPKVQVAAIRVTESLSSQSTERQMALLRILQALTEQDTPGEVLFQAALSGGNLPKPQVIPVLAKIVSKEIHHLIIREAVVTGLHHWELQFLQYLLSDPAWTESQPGRSAILQALAGAIIKEAIPTKVELLLSLTSEQNDHETLWRRRSLLEGIAENARGRITNKIRFREQPSAWQILERDELPSHRTLLNKSLALFNWGDLDDGLAAENPVILSTIPKTKQEAERLSKGKALYQQVCAGCHGLNGEGLKPLAPPLANSEWLSESSERLIKILLHGITGPVEVGGSSYQPPDILPEMPALAVLNDNQIAEVLSYISNEWSNSADRISSDHVAKIRSATVSRRLPWTQEELLRVK